MFFFNGCAQCANTRNVQPGAEVSPAESNMKRCGDTVTQGAHSTLSSPRCEGGGTSGFGSSTAAGERHLACAQSVLVGYISGEGKLCWLQCLTASATVAGAAGAAAYLAASASFSVAAAAAGAAAGATGDSVAAASGAGAPPFVTADS